MRQKGSACEVKSRNQVSVIFTELGAGRGRLDLTMSDSAPCGHSSTTPFGDLLTSGLSMLIDNSQVFSG